MGKSIISELPNGYIELINVLDKFIGVLVGLI